MVVPSTRAPADRRLLAIMLVVFVQIAGAGLIIPILPSFAKNDFGLSKAAVTPLLASYFIAQFFASPLLGRLSDRYGRLPVLIVSQIGTAVSFVWLVLAASPVDLFGARILDGITGGNILVAQAYVTDITPVARRTQALGMVFGMLGLGFIVGPAAGGLLASVGGERLPFFVAAVVSALTVLLTWWVLDESLPAAKRNLAPATATMKADRRWDRILADGRLLNIMLLSFVGSFVLGLIQACLALYGEEVIFKGAPLATIQRNNGLLMTVVGLTQVLVQLVLLKRLLVTVGEPRLVALGTVVRGLGMLVYARVAAPWQAVVAAALFAFGTGVSMPPLQSLATKLTPDDQRGSVLGLYQAVMNLGTIISMTTAGLLMTLWVRLPFYLGFVYSVALVLPAWWLIRSLRPAGATHPADSEGSTRP